LGVALATLGPVFLRARPYASLPPVPTAFGEGSGGNPAMAGPLRST